MAVAILFRCDCNGHCVVPCVVVFPSLLTSLELSHHVACCSEAFLSQLFLCLLGHLVVPCVCVCVLVAPSPLAVEFDNSLDDGQCNDDFDDDE